MDVGKFVKTYPILYHMAECGSWSSISKYGLLSTSALLDLFEYKGKDRRAVESSHRPESINISHHSIGTAVVRDQKPMGDDGLRRCLVDGLTPREWYEILNSKVFFWTSLDRLSRLLNARPYRDKAHDVLIVRTAPLVDQYGDRIVLSPINSGCTKPYPHPRGAGTFLPISEYPFESWAAKRPTWDAVVEVAIEGGISNIQDFVRRVTKMKADKKLGRIWKP